MKYVRKISWCLLVFLLAGLFVGCLTLGQQATPAPIDRQTAEYVYEALNKSPKDYPKLFGYNNLAMSLQLEKDLEHAHLFNQFIITNELEKDNMVYNRFKEIQGQNTQTATEVYEKVFSPDGILATGLIAALTGIGGWKLLPRSGDVPESKVDEVKNELSIVKETDEAKTNGALAVFSVLDNLKRNNPEVAAIWESTIGPSLKHKEVEILSKGKKVIMPDKILNDSVV